MNDNSRQTSEYPENIHSNMSRDCNNIVNQTHRLHGRIRLCNLRTNTVVKKLRFPESALSNPGSRPSLAHAFAEHFPRRRLQRSSTPRSVDFSHGTNTETACLAGDQPRRISLRSVDGAHSLTKRVSVYMDHCSRITQ